MYSPQLGGILERVLVGKAITGGSGGGSGSSGSSSGHRLFKLLRVHPWTDFVRVSSVRLTVDCSHVL